MNPLAVIEKWISEHGSSATLRDHVALLKEQMSVLENKNRMLEEKNRVLEQQNANLEAENVKLRQQVQELSKPKAAVSMVSHGRGLRRSDLAGL